MPILNYTTTIKAEKTIMEIQQILVKNGATKIVTDYDGEYPKAVTFCLNLNGNIIGYSLPANYHAILNILRNDRQVPRRLVTNEQALKISWRIIKNWIEAQIALVQSDLAEMSEVFLPYTITPSGNTLYNQIKENGMKMLKSNEI